MLKTIDEYKIFVGKNIVLIGDLTDWIINNFKINKSKISDLDNNYNFVYAKNPRIFINQNWEQIIKFFDLNNKYSMTFIDELKDALLYLFRNWWER